MAGACLGSVDVGVSVDPEEADVASLLMVVVGNRGDASDRKRVVAANDERNAIRLEGNLRSLS